MEHRDAAEGAPHKGVPVSFEEVKAAFSFLDAAGKGYLTRADLQERLPAFYPGLKPKEYQTLMKKKSTMTLDELYGLLRDNELTDFDPVAEAFQFYDPENTGYVDPNVLRGLLESLGLGSVTDEDLATLISASDIDGDGYVNVEDFRRMITEGSAMFDAAQAGSSAAEAAGAPAPGARSPTSSKRR